MKVFILLAALCALAGCAASGPPMVSSSDPVWQLNPGRWQATENDLRVPPDDGQPRPLPSPRQVPASWKGSWE